MGDYDPANLEGDPVNDLWGQKAWWLETNRGPPPPPPPQCPASGPSPADMAYSSAAAAAAAAAAYTSASSGLAGVYGGVPAGPPGPAAAATAAGGVLVGPGVGVGPMASGRTLAGAYGREKAYGHPGLVGGAHMGFVGGDKIPYDQGTGPGSEMMRASYERSRMPHFGDIQARGLNQGLNQGLSQGLTQGLSPGLTQGLHAQALSSQSQPMHLGREKPPMAAFPIASSLPYDRPVVQQQQQPQQQQPQPFSKPMGLPQEKSMRFAGESKLMTSPYQPPRPAVSPVFAPIKQEGLATAAAHFVPDKLGAGLNGTTAPSPVAVAAAAAAAAVPAREGLPAPEDEKKHKLSVHERPGKKVTSRRRAKTGNPKRGLHYCKLCEYSASTKGNLTRHVRVIHERLKPFPCNQCSHKSSTSQNLETHTMKVHAQFFCDRCVEYFPSKEEYKRHKFVVHSHAATKPSVTPRRT